MDALIFDFDGLILDTESAEFQSWTEIFQSHGAELALSTWAGCVGTSWNAFNPFDHLEQCVGRPVDRQEVKDRRRRRSDELIGNQPPLPGVVDYLENARRMKIALGVASSSHEEWVVGHLSRLGLAPYFHCIRTATDVQNVKPHPELYLSVLNSMGVDPRRALAFEDSPNGIKAAKAAGLFCVAVPNSVTRNLPLAGADMVLSSMADLPLKDLLHRIEAGGRN